MGGDAWATTGPDQEQVATAFRRLQEQQLQRDDRGFEGQSIDELWRDPDWQEYIFTGGTGSVLDFFAFVDGPDAKDEEGRMRLLTEPQVRAWSPSGRPTRAEWTEMLGSDQLPYPDRACGQCTVLYRDGQPSEIGYWGVTAD